MSSRNMEDLTVYKKTTHAYEIRFKKNGYGVDITGWKVYFTAKSKREDLDANAVISKDVSDHLDATNGRSLIQLTETDTNLDVGTYWYDIRYKDDEDNTGILFEGRLKIELPITQRTS